ncbi:MAG: O-methyltransferase, family 2 [Acidobacteria bacterium]|nr:O-methyltransferase, family 2 [Acidobacteriota bacterium]
MIPKCIELMEIASGFQQARILLSAVELGIFEKLGTASRTARQLSDECQTDPRATQYLLDALAAIGVLQKRTSVYSLPKRVARWLSPSSEDCILPMLQHWVFVWNRWHCLTSVIRHGHPVDWPPSLNQPSEPDRTAFIGAMHVLARLRADEIARACIAASHSSRLLDIGGASGTYTLAFLKCYRNLEASIFDLPQVIPLAEKRIGATRFAARVRYYSGDFFRDELPGGHDLALLSAIIHQNSREENVALFKKVHRALDKGGTLLIRDHVMNKKRTRPPLGAVFAVNMLLATKGGGTYTRQEIEEDLLHAGFGKIRMIRRGEYMDCLVEARKF